MQQRHDDDEEGTLITDGEVQVLRIGVYVDCLTGDKVLCLIKDMVMSLYQDGGILAFDHGKPPAEVFEQTCLW